MTRKPSYADFAKWRAENVKASTNQVLAAFPSIDSMTAHAWMSIFNRKNRRTKKS